MKTIGKCIYCNDPIYNFQDTVHSGCGVKRETEAIIKWLNAWEFGQKYAGVGGEIRDSITSALKEDYL